nr:hypothetical protein [Tanacetum cinerariifolium]
MVVRSGCRGGGDGGVRYDEVEVMFVGTAAGGGRGDEAAVLGLRFGGEGGVEMVCDGWPESGRKLAKKGGAAPKKYNEGE